MFFSMGRPNVSWAALSCLSIYEPNMRCLGSSEGQRISQLCMLRNCYDGLMPNISHSDVSRALLFIRIKTVCGCAPCVGGRGHVYCKGVSIPDHNLVCGERASRCGC